MEIPQFQSSRSPRWNDSRLKIGGVVIVILAAGVLMIHRDPEQRLSLPQDLDTEMGLREIGGDPGGLAPGQAIGAYGNAVDRAVGDSLSMARGANRKPTPKEMAAARPDWNEALRQVSKGKKKKKKKKKPKGIVSKLKAMLARWGGSSGGSGSGMNLSKPSSKGFKLARRTGPGKYGRVRADSAYRSKYGDGSRSRRAKKKEHVGVSGFLASAANSARSMFGGGSRNSAARGPIKPGGGGTAGGGTVDTPGIPETGEGKPVEDVKDSTKKDDDDDSTSEEDRQKALIDAMTGALGASAGGKWRFGGGGDSGSGDPGGQGVTPIDTGVGDDGMSSDANAEVALSEKLVEGGNTLKAGTAPPPPPGQPPEYGAGTALGEAAGPLAQVRGIKPYKREEIDTAVTEAKAMPVPPTYDPLPLLDVTGIPGGMTRAVGLINNAQTSQNELLPTLIAARTSLGEHADAVGVSNEKAFNFSGELGRNQGKAVTSFETLDGSIQTDFEGMNSQWTGANDTVKQDFVTNATQIIDTYTPEAGSIQTESTRLQDKATALFGDHTTRINTSGGNLLAARRDLGVQNATYQIDSQALRTEINSLSLSLAGTDPAMQRVRPTLTEIIATIDRNEAKTLSWNQNLVSRTLLLDSANAGLRISWQGK